MERIEANGTSISFKRSGEGPPLLLLHGAEADHSMFDAFGAALAPHFTVIAYDQRDSGGTRNPLVPYRLIELADDLAALIAALGLARAHVFGTSFGGAIAQVAAIRHAARIDRLVLAGSEDLLIPPAHTLSLAREIAGARTAVIPGVGHVGTIQDPAAVAAEVVAFLQSEKPEDLVEENDHGGRERGSRHIL